MRPAVLCLPLLLVACASATPPAPPTLPSTPALPLRPASSPDFYILGVSGKCLRDDLGRLCQNLIPSGVQALNTANNYDYLSGRGTLDAIAGAAWDVRVNACTTLRATAPVIGAPPAATSQTDSTSLAGVIGFTR